MYKRNEYHIITERLKEERKASIPKLKEAVLIESNKFNTYEQTRIHSSQQRLVEG